MLDEGHLRHQIGSLNQSFGGASAGEGNVGELRPFIEALQDLIEFEVAKLQGHIHLVQHHQFLFGVSEVRERGLPSRLHQLTITLSILGFPGETLAQGMPAQGISKGFQCFGFSRLPASFDELDNSHLVPVPQGP